MKHETLAKSSSNSGKNLTLEDMNFLIVQSEFNRAITDQLLNGCLEVLEKSRVATKQIDAFTVPGAFELPLGIHHHLRRKRYHAAIALGCVVRGETPHFEYICQSVSQGLMNLQFQHEIPIIFGVLTTNTWEQAERRAGISHSPSPSSDSRKAVTENKGKEAAEAAIKMAFFMA